MSMTYNLNLIPGKVPVAVHVKQYDTGLREITFNLYYGDTAYSVPYNSTITVSGTKPDGNGFSYSVTFSGSAVTVPMQEQMTVLAGEFPCQLTIANSGEIIGTASFLLCVEPAALSSDTPASDTDLAMFQQLANQTQTEAAGVANATAQIATNTQDIATNTAAITALNGKTASIEARFGSFLPANTNIDNLGVGDGGMWLYERVSPRNHIGTFPQTDTYGWLINIPGTSANFGAQIIRSNNVAASSGMFYIRFRVGGSWGAWMKIVATDI